MILAAEFLAIPSSAVKIASERRCAILVHSVVHPPEEKDKLGVQSWSAVVKQSLAKFSGKKKGPKPKIYGPDIFWWGGGLLREGVGAKKFGMFFETHGNQTFGRDIPGFCRDIPGAPERKV